MNAQQEGIMARLLAGLLVTGVVTFVLWGVWIFLAVVLGGSGWLLSTVGDLLQRVMDFMASVRGAVGWIAFGIGVLVGAVLAVLLPPDRIVGPLQRLRRLRRPRHPAA